MKLLLDTHIWIWSHLEPGRLIPAVAAALEDSKTELWLSPISIWELLVLVGKGRVTLTSEVDDWVSLALDRAPMNEAPLTHEVALATRSIDLPHNDPADRLLAATATVLGLTLVTADRRLIEAPGLSVFANR